MPSNLKALLRRATPMSKERARECIDSNMTANAHRYQLPAETSEPMESPDIQSEDEDSDSSSQSP
jgi:hypothetical protein